MKKIIALAAALLLVGTQAIADPGIRITPCGYQQITLAGAATKLTVPTTCNLVTMIRVMTETAAVRYRDDNVAPTASVGFPIAVAVQFDYLGAVNNIQFIQQTGTATLNVLYYK